MLNCAIGIVLYNRPKYTKLLFEALELNHYSNIFPIYISIDFSDKLNNILEIIQNYKNKLNIVELKINDPKKGCGHNHISLINSIREDDFIIFEDDTIPLAHDALNFFYSQLPFLKDNNLFSICGYSKNGNKNISYDHYINNHFCPWGFAMTKSKWLDVKVKIFDNGWKNSWDTAIHNGIEDKRTIYPHIGRIQNVGAEQGVHVPSAEWHHINHHVEFGAWNIEIEKKELGAWNK